MSTIGYFSVLISTIFIQFCFKVNGFNVDTQFPITFQEKDESYFGFSVAFHSNGTHNSIIIGAPKSQSSSFGYFKSGAIFKCELNSKNCREIILENKAELNLTKVEPLSNQRYIDGVDDMWMGASVTTQNKYPWNTVVCGHRWHSNIVVPTSAFYYVTGVCYLVSGTRENSKPIKMLPMYSDSFVRDQSLISAIAQTGISSTYSEDSENLYLGSPGYHSFAGGLAKYSTKSRNFTKPILQIPFSNKLTNYGFGGYSVTSGHFYEPGNLFVALGAPMSGRLRGGVHICHDTQNKNLVEKEFLQGTQMGSYFGASLLGVNLNGDEYTDLLVGAPLHSSDVDEGRVYVYISDGKMLSYKFALEGSNKPKARFGSAIANIGDINFDSYTDVAVGAPYEDDAGVVYLYHGSKMGIKPTYIQKITAQEVNPRLKGFGRSIAKSQDIDNNHYPDLLIGAYSSSNAVVLRSRPIVMMNGSISFDINQIDREGQKNCLYKGQNKTCFTIAACVLLDGFYVPDNMMVEMKLSIDPKEDREFLNSRGHFILQNESATNSIQMTVQVQKSKERCIQKKIYVFEEEDQDYLTPMFTRMTLDFQRPLQVNSFCPTCPVLDPKSQKTVTKEISFATGCGDDNVCIANLQIIASIMNYREFEVLVLGQNKTVGILIEIANIGELAYSTKTLIKLGQPGQDISLIRTPPNCKESKSNTNLENLLDIECNLGNPFKTKTELIITLDTSLLANTVEEIQVKAEATTTSQLSDRDNIKFVLSIPFKAEADLFLTGIADSPTSALLGAKDEVRAYHNYEVRKYGPSPIDIVNLEIKVPVSDYKSIDRQFLILESVEVFGSSGSALRGFCNSSVYTEGYTSGISSGMSSGGQPGTDLDVNIGQRDTPNTFDPSKVKPTLKDDEKIIEGEAQTAYTQFNCKTFFCLSIFCTMGPFKRQYDLATIRIKSSLNLTEINNALGVLSNFSYVTEGEVYIGDKLPSDPQKINKYPDEAFVEMRFLRDVPPPEIPLPKYIIALAAGGGFLLLILILIGLLQFGFFRRRKHEEIQRLLQQGTVVKHSEEIDREEEEEETNENGTTL